MVRLYGPRPSGSEVIGAKSSRIESGHGLDLQRLVILTLGGRLRAVAADQLYRSGAPTGSHVLVREYEVSLCASPSMSTTGFAAACLRKMRVAWTKSRNPSFDIPVPRHAHVRYWAGATGCSGSIVRIPPAAANGCLPSVADARACQLVDRSWPVCDRRASGRDQRNYWVRPRSAPRRFDHCSASKQQQALIFAL
jgi:hypothetical protein